MLLFWILLSLGIFFCTTTKTPNRVVGKYSQLLLSQKSPIAEYYSLRNVWPTTDIDCDYSSLTEKSCEALFKPDSWIIRGLYPHKRGGPSPQGCMAYVDGYVRFFINATLRERLQLQWPNFIKRPEGEDIYEITWHRHGSCAADVTKLNTVQKYFNKALELLNIYNVGALLKENDIVPGSTYSIIDIYNLIKSEFNTKPRVKCFTLQNSEKEQEQYLFQVDICFNKTLHLENCYHTGYHSCNGSLPVNYATIIEV